MTTLDFGNNETWRVGLIPDGDEWLAMTLTDSKSFKNRKAAEKWLAARGYAPDGSKIR